MMSTTATKKHIFVCVQNRPVGHPRGSCQAKDSPSVFDAFATELRKRLPDAPFRLTNTGCLGPCDHGASVVVYPDGVLYGGVSAEDVPEIVAEHVEGGTPVTRLVDTSW